MADTDVAVAGLGTSAIGKTYTKSSPRLAADAVRSAAADAGIPMSDIDGLLFSNGMGTPLDMRLQMEIGLPNLKMASYVQAFGSTAALMVGYAAMAIRAGMADTIAVVWSDDPIKPKLSGGAAYAANGRANPQGFGGLQASNGIYSANTMYALAARRHMQRFGTTQDQLGHIAVAQRQWANLNPMAQFHDVPLTLEEYHASRYIAEPFHLFDCCLVSNGSVALIVTSLERARTLAQPPVRVLGWAQSHPGYASIRDDRFGIVTGAAQSGPRALKMASTALDEIGVVEVYDCYTFTALITLEDYGFFPKGEGGPGVAEAGMLGPEGRLKVNTGGGELSAFYLWGMTPLHEAVVQARGQAGERQVADHDRVLVSGNGGVLDYHGTLVLGTDK